MQNDLIRVIDNPIKPHTTFLDAITVALTKIRCSPERSQRYETAFRAIFAALDNQGMLGPDLYMNLCMVNAGVMWQVMGFHGDTDSEIIRTMGDALWLELTDIDPRTDSEFYPEPQASRLHSLRTRV